MFVLTCDFQQRRELRLRPLIKQLNPDNLLVHGPAYYRKNSVVDLDEGNRVPGDRQSCNKDMKGDRRKTKKNDGHVVQQHQMLYLHDHKGITVLQKLLV